MASTVSLHDFYLNNNLLTRLPLNATTEINPNNNRRLTTNEQQQQQRCATNGNNLNSSGLVGDRWSTSGSSSSIFPQQFTTTTTACSTPASAAALATPLQQQYRFGLQEQHRQQQQPGNFNRQSQIQGSVPAGNAPQQHQYYKPSPFHRNNYPPNSSPFNTNPTLTSPSLAQPPNQNQLEYLRWLQQFQQQQQQGQSATGPPPQPIERPWQLWFIGWVDILSAAFFTASAVYLIFKQPISDPDSFIWRFFIGFLSILAKLLMGFGLLTGLRSDDDSGTLWYCKLWLGCQTVFLFTSVYDVVTSALLYVSKSHVVDTRLTAQLPIVLPVQLGLFAYRCICFVLVRKFIGKLKKSEAVTLANAQEQQLRYRPTDEEADSENRKKFGTGESAFCGPSAALILSL